MADDLVTGDVIQAGRHLPPPLECLVFRGIDSTGFHLEIIDIPSRGTRYPGPVWYRANAKGECVFAWGIKIYVLKPVLPGKNSINVYERT